MHYVSFYAVYTLHRLLNYLHNYTLHNIQTWFFGHARLSYDIPELWKLHTNKNKQMIKTHIQQIIFTRTLIHLQI